MATDHLRAPEKWPDQDQMRAVEASNSASFNGVECVIGFYNLQTYRTCSELPEEQEFSFEVQRSLLWCRVLAGRLQGSKLVNPVDLWHTPSQPDLMDPIPTPCCSRIHFLQALKVKSLLQGRMRNSILVRDR